MKNLNGIGGSKGYARGHAVVKESSAPRVEKITVQDTEAEKAKYRQAQEAYVTRMEQLAEQTEREIGPEAAEIFTSYVIIARDETFVKKIFERIDAGSVCAEYATHEECAATLEIFLMMDDPYLRERADDIRNVCHEMIAIMTGQGSDLSAKMAGIQDAIIIADDLTPAETVKIDKKALRGIVTEKGGLTSHTVILAKVLGIPAIVGAKGVLEAVKDGDELLVDAFTGTVTLDADDGTVEAFIQKQQAHEKEKTIYAAAAKKEAVTTDGIKIDVNINIGDPDSIQNFDPERCDGVGLFRTEFIYMDSRGYPDEEKQYQEYKKVAEAAGDKEVIIRTLDIGGDKQASYMELPKEENPFLGYRAIRLCLDRQDVFRTQMRAVLRASAHGNVKMMFPLVVCMEELREAKELLEGEKKALREAGIPFNEDMPVGIMVETPAAVFIADQLAKEVDFFSIGSNDLIQYTTATDRMNERVQELYDCYNPAILRAVSIVAQAADAAAIPWGICGEVASEEMLVPVWVGMGVSELSVVPSQVGAVKHLISQLSSMEAHHMVDELLALDCTTAVEEYLENLAKGLGA